MKAALWAASYVNRTVMAGPLGLRTWNPGGTDVPPDGRVFFPDWPRFTRADRASRFVLAASTLLPPVPEDPSRVAVILGSRTGCLDADRAFTASLGDRPLPATYARTLPSTAGAELAILRGLRGPNYTLVQDAAPDLLAVAAAVQELEAGRCDAAVAGAYDAVEGADGSGWACLLLLGRSTDPDAPSLMVTRTPTQDAESPRDGSPLIDLVEFLYDPATPPERRWSAVGAGSRLELAVERKRGAP